MTATLSVRPGDTAYLVPRTMGAPSAAWRQPAVTVVATPWPMITVRLDDGTELTTHEHNVVRSLPRVPAPRRAARPARPAASRLDLPPDAEEVPMF